MLKLSGERFGLMVGLGRLNRFGRAYQQVSGGAAFVAFWTPVTGFVVLTWRGLTVTRRGRFFGRIWRPWRPLALPVSCPHVAKGAPVAVEAETTTGRLGLFCASCAAQSAA